MRANTGDRIVLAGKHVGEPTRDGRVVEARGQDGGPPYVVEWSDGHTGVIYPGPGAVLRVTGPDDPPPERAPVAQASGDPSGAAGPPEPASPTREWTVRVSIFESADDTSARAVLVADAPQRLVATGESHRSHRDEPVAEIGDEVAVARALRHLADTLMEAAEDDIASMTGQDAQVRRT
jgi:hypothetical protein